MSRTIIARRIIGSNSGIVSFAAGDNSQLWNVSFVLDPVQYCGLTLANVATNQCLMGVPGGSVALRPCVSEAAFVWMLGALSSQALAMHKELDYRPSPERLNGSAT